MAQPRIDQLVSLAEAESKGREDGGTRLNNNYGNRVEPFRVTMVGDSTMMQQHGVICAFLGERPDRRFDPAVRRCPSRTSCASVEVSMDVAGRVRGRTEESCRGCCLASSS